MEQNLHETFMWRCIELAKKAAGHVAPNPMVGSVLVHHKKIIGEGYHEYFGGPHAEVNCIQNALQNHPDLVSKSTLYVSLEPCAHYGKTPPCADLIIKHQIPKVVIACRDSFEKVDGKGIAKLINAGVLVTENVLQKEAIHLNKRFFTYHQYKRPYIKLKWAQTADRYIASLTKERLLISNDYSNSLVHQWRSEEAAILIGANTAFKDDPLLDNRHWYGPAPVKIIIDPQLKLPNNLRLYHQGQRVIILNEVKDDSVDRINFIKLSKENFLPQALQKLHEMQIQSILVEGGRRTLQCFIDAGLWDEACVITNTKLYVGSGLQAPVLHNAIERKEENFLNDTIAYFSNGNNNFV